MRLLNLIDKKRILIDFPLPLANISARFFELMPNPLLTRDQLRILKYDNIKGIAAPKVPAKIRLKSIAKAIIEPNK